jgi:hypothetical protein
MLFVSVGYIMGMTLGAKLYSVIESPCVSVWLRRSIVQQEHRFFVMLLSLASSFGRDQSSRTNFKSLDSFVAV